MDETTANALCAVLFRDFGTKAPLVADGVLTDGDWREPADLSSEVTFVAQCQRWRESLGLSPAALLGARGGAAGRGKSKRRETSYDAVSGSLSGAAGTGAAKRRSPEHYREMARRSAERRRK